jgi:prepilin-type N-terminal cleavage/methylation domain-containing protein
MTNLGPSPNPTPAPRSSPRQRAFTLVELATVVVVLVVLAGVAVSAAGDATTQAVRAATQTSMTAARDAIVGVGHSRSDLTGRCFVGDLGRLPTGVQELLDGRTLSAYDPATGRGWRGPYVLAPRATFGDLDATLPVSPSRQPMWSRYGQPTDAALLDGHGRPLVLQIPDADGDGSSTDDDRRHARLVSAGADGLIDTPRDVYYPTLTVCADDLVLYLRVADLRTP